jgi:predicted nucleotidyltransferase
MTASLPDVSVNLDPLTKEALRAVDQAGRHLNVPFLLVGAAARDILLGYLHGVDTGRRTLDMDIGVLVGTWAQYSRLIQYLSDRYPFVREREGILHRYRYRGRLLLDIIPFGALADELGEIFWPPDADPQMCVLGFEEALDHAILVQVDAGLQTRVVSLPGLAMLKLLAWADRRYRTGSDIYDLVTILKCYGEIHQERLFEEHKDIFEEHGYDVEMAGVVVLGKDMALIMSKGTQKRVARILLQGDTDVSENHDDETCSSNEQLVLELQCRLPGQQYERAERLVKGMLKGMLRRGQS